MISSHRTTATTRPSSLIDYESRRMPEAPPAKLHSPATCSPSPSQELPFVVAIAHEVTTLVLNNYEYWINALKVHSNYDNK